MNCNSWIERWEKAIKACNSIGGETRELLISPPASDEDVVKVEEGLGLNLPTSFRTVLTDFSSSVTFSWFLPDEKEPTDELRGIFSGQCYWDLARLIDIDKGRKEWVEKCFSNENDDYDRVWHNKLAFLEVGNGDYLAFDLDSSTDSPIVYLSHDDGECHGYRLGDNFIDFIDKWSMIGCPGAEDWQMLPFINSSTSGIDPFCNNAIKWRAWFGFECG